MRPILATTLSGLFLLTLDACDLTTSCTDDARASLQLHLVDASTQADITNATVTYLVDGEGPYTAEDMSLPDYVLGYEQDGTFSVTIEAEGYETVVREYEVDSDECHVITVQDTVELTATP